MFLTSMITQPTGVLLLKTNTSVPCEEASILLLAETLKETKNHSCHL